MTFSIQTFSVSTMKLPTSIESTAETTKTTSMFTRFSTVRITGKNV